MAKKQKRSKSSKHVDISSTANFSRNQSNNTTLNDCTTYSSNNANVFPPHLFQKNTTKTKSERHNHTSITYENVTTLVESAVFLHKNFLSKSECEAWIQHAEQNIGFEAIHSPQTREYAQRQCGRIQKTDWDIADQLYQRMKPIVDQVSKLVSVSNAHPSYAPVACNGNIRIYKYEKNMSFGKHYDGSDRVSRYLGGNTEITVLIYLSSCVGGATRFYLPTGSSRKKSRGTAKAANANTTINKDDRGGIAFVPEEGAILLHMHGDRCLEHEADPVLQGVKYVLRTDIVYANSPTPQ